MLRFLFREHYIQLSDFRCFAGCIKLRLFKALGLTVALHARVSQILSRLKICLICTLLFFSSTFEHLLKELSFFKLLILVLLVNGACWKHHVFDICVSSGVMQDTIDNLLAVQLSFRQATLPLGVAHFTALLVHYLSGAPSLKLVLVGKHLNLVRANFLVDQREPITLHVLIFVHFIDPDR